MRPSKIKDQITAITISIHAPLAGCDIIGGNPSDTIKISIHAPLAGCDWWNVFRRGDVYRFQSTHPLRGATSRKELVCSFIGFQSTHPLRGATLRREVAGNRQRISIHAPLAGCDACKPEGIRFCSKFQSTHPLRGATGRFWEYAELYRFQSTHPLRGATRRTIELWHWKKFQSTHPLRGATRSEARDAEIQCISIHAPLAGCDIDQIDTTFAREQFQSTHPLRGATAEQ